MLKTRLADVCKEIADLADKACVDKDDKGAFAKLKSKSGDEDDVKNSIRTIMRMMHAAFGDSYVYCPWDVVNYVSALKTRKDAKPKNYWRNTSHNGILLAFVKRTDFRVKGKFEILMNGGTIVQTISDELTYDTLHSSEDNL